MEGGTGLCPSRWQLTWQECWVPLWQTPSWKLCISLPHQAFVKHQYAKCATAIVAQEPALRSGALERGSGLSAVALSRAGDAATRATMARREEAGQRGGQAWEQQTPAAAAGNNQGLWHDLGPCCPFSHTCIGCSTASSCNLPAIARSGQRCSASPHAPNRPRVPRRRPCLPRRLLQLRVGNVIEHQGKLLQVVSLQNRAMGVSLIFRSSWVAAA